MLKDVKKDIYIKCTKNIYLYIFLSEVIHAVTFLRVILQSSDLSNRNTLNIPQHVYIV